MSIEELKENIQENIEWLETSEENYIIEAISIENLESILTKFLGNKIKLSIDGEENL